MYKSKSLAVVIPTFNDGHLIEVTLKTIPDIVDKIIVVNDGSNENESNLIKDCAEVDGRIFVIYHPKNLGLGQSLIDGYVFARDHDFDIIAVMAGDNQMAPSDLENVINPIADNSFDYVKGNRLLRDDVRSRMPKYRFIGNSILSLLTKFATGYWKLIDPQCGYTAISRPALKQIPIETMIKGYGYNAHILNMLNLNNFRVKDVEVEPVYGDEKSKIKVLRYAANVSLLLLRLTLKRLTNKYLIRDFHPLFLLYFFSFVQLILITFPLSIRFVYLYMTTGFLPQTTLLITFFSFSIGIFCGLMAMWMDMEDNKPLQKS